MKRRNIVLIRCVYVIIILIGIAVAIPSFIKARSTSSQQACINNLRMIDARKTQWAMAAITNNPSDKK